jgi:exopolyphosphatase/guanosine-5'-triphosphate,3'-diphosphate pyrophosphatase
VVDIGGGSTELAWGEDRAEPDRVASFKVGCVGLRDGHFEGGTGQAAGYAAARRTALEAFAGLDAPVAADVIGTSGTVESVQTVLAANGWGAGDITRKGLAALAEAIVSGRWLVEAGLPGLAPERVDIFPAGLAVLDALFEVLGLDSMRFVDASLQDGLLCRRIESSSGDLRDDLVLRLQDRFGVDRTQAARVRGSALALFDNVATWWVQPDRWRSLLAWSADLHEIGKAVSHRHYHRHGAYLLQNSDLRSFSGAQCEQLVLLVRGHRRAFPGMALRAVDSDVREDLLKLLAVLRLAVIVNRSHGDAHVPALYAVTDGLALRLTLPDGWLAAHPLSAKELEVEAVQLASAGLDLHLVEGSPAAAEA